MPKKYLGQHFLYDQSFLKRIVAVSDITAEDIVVEIGPGPGSLTQVLADKTKRLIAIELDEDLFRKLQRSFIAYRNIELFHADALTFPYENIGTFKVVANIPYYITTPIIFRLLEARQHLRSMTLTIQKEVAERIVASPGGKEYGVLSIMVQYHANTELKFIIPKEAFRPAPKVDSAVIHLTIRDKPCVSVTDEELFFRIIKTAFSQRRKTMLNAMKQIQNILPQGIEAMIKDILVRAGIDPIRRAETLSIEEFARLSDKFSDVA